MSGVSCLVDGQVTSDTGQIGISSVVQQQLNAVGVSRSGRIQQDTFPVTSLRVHSAT